VVAVAVSLWPPQPSPKILVLIRTSLRPDGDLTAYEAMDARMNELVSQAHRRDQA
jgi:hypothetical protein